MTESSPSAARNAQTAPDNYALDDTLAGRAAQAAAVGILTALPDYLKTKAGLTTGYLVGFTSFGALVAWANAEREDHLAYAPLADADAADAPDAEGTPSAAAPLDTAGASFAVLAVIVAVALLSLIPGVAASRALTKALAKRGIGKPWTVLGAVAAALTFAVSEAEARGLDRAADRHV
ncbi:hypothetical protein [uncultured Corynebacterium sp.]|uniref:hypothetical protein n=1 Tax=uncultured Corynebacterium sp. TaxID=159447 RepID=UPI0025E37B47|nr:hypothetical protein [uncultured Corynebacterium sp.]